MSGSHILTGEQSRLRRWTLYLFARYLELPLLDIGYRLTRGNWRRWGKTALARTVLGWGVAAPIGYLGDTGRPTPYPEVLRMIDELEGPIAVGPCRCRSTHKSCPHPLETDIVIRTGVEAWTAAFPDEYRLIGKEEAKTIITQCHKLGLWQMVFVHCPVHLINEYVICNCCTCGCVPYLLNRELGQRRFPLLFGRFVSRTDPERCRGAGECVTACPFQARALVDGWAHPVGPCYGCGRCVAVCPEGAIRIVPRRT